MGKEVEKAGKGWVVEDRRWVLGSGAGFYSPGGGSHGRFLSCGETSSDLLRRRAEVW